MKTSSENACPTAVVDVHAHHLGSDLATAGLVADDRWPSLVVDDEDRGRIMLGNRVFREVRASLWDLDRRLAEMDAAGVALQVLSPVPVMMTTWADRARATEYAEATNDSLAAVVRDSGGRIEALGALPLPHVADAVAELERAVTVLGLRGAQIGTQVNGIDLDDPSLAPLFEAAEGLGAALFVHPTDGGGGVVRRSGQPYDFGLGMTTDTAIAAGSLVLGGVLERFPRLRVGLAHGCGTFGWVYPRLRLGASLWCGADPAALDSALRRLWVDSLVLDPAHLSLLVHRFGGDRVMVGTDHPFVPGQLEAVDTFVRSPDGGLDDDQATAVLGANGLAFLGLPVDHLASYQPQHVRASS